MAALTFYMVNTTSGGWQLMDETSPGADAQASPATGWVVSSTTPGSSDRSSFQASTERAVSTFAASSSQPDGSLDGTLFDALRSDVSLNGDFASANWTINGVVRAANNGGSQDGRLYYRLFKADADGSNATEITAAAQQGALLTNVSTSADFNSSVTFNPGAFNIANQYLFIQLAWERTGAGGMTTSDINFRIGTTATRVVTADFTVAANNYTLAVDAGSFALAGQTAALKYGRKLAALAAAFTLTGAAASLRYGRKLVAGNGSFALAGQDATLTYTPGGYVMPAAAGSFTLTGSAASLEYGRELSAGLGGFTLAGSNVVFHRTYRMAADAGIFALTGDAVMLLYSTGTVAQHHSISPCLHPSVGVKMGFGRR